MILKLYTAAALITVAALVSCAGDNDKDYVDKSIIPAGSENTTAQPVAPNTTTPNTNVLPAGTVPANTTVIPGTNTVNIKPQQPGVITAVPQNNNVAVATPANTAQTVTAPGMNPPHGQPGHRCDISVGAPLNSKPAAANAQPATVSTQPSNVTVTQQPTQQKTAPGMNPPHGEPNHRCDIAVGAPLNSKPVVPAAAPAVQTTAPPALLTPAKSDSSKN